MKNRKNIKRNKVMIENIIFVLILIVIFKIMTSYQLAKTELSTYEYTVSNGDTIWTIASSICKDNKDLNIYNVIADIKDINEIDNSIIYTNQIIELPIYE